MAKDKTRTKTFASVSKERDLVLVIRDLGNERLNAPKKLFPVRPNTALRIRKEKEEKNGNCKAFCITRKRIKKFIFMKNMVLTSKLATGRCSKQ